MTPPAQGRGDRRLLGRAPDNEEIAERLERVADLLEAQDASSFRVNAYRAGARTCRELPEPLAVLLRTQGTAGLVALPGIGKSLAAAIAEILESGGLRLQDRLEGEVSAERLFSTLPGVGETLAHAIHEGLGAETLEELEIAAHDGRLERVAGIGRRRAQAIRNALEHVLRQRSGRRARASPVRRPPVGALLALDRRYRSEAEAGTLRRIAPRRFNPEHRAWLPVLHGELPGADDAASWHATVLFSNTARAHELGRTGDWVVIYAERDGEEDRGTVVTEAAGPLRGRRVVRGRERECAAHYSSDPVANRDGA